MKHLIAALVLSLPMAACTTSGTVQSPPAAAVSTAAEVVAITALLEQQDDAWNRGDIDAFMDGYWRGSMQRLT